MSFLILNRSIQRHLIRAFAMLDEWFDRDPALLFFKTEDNVTIAGLLKSIVRDNEHMLLVPTFEDGTSTDYSLGRDELKQTIRYWHLPAEDVDDIDLLTLRRQFRDQLYQALFLLETSELTSTETFNPLAHSNADSWDGYHRLYFMGLLIKRYVRQFAVIEESHYGVIMK